jgi:hypothetical protein
MDMRSASSSAVALAVFFGCHVEHVELGDPNAPTESHPPTTGACGTVPAVLAAIRNVEPRLMAMDDANVYVVSSPVPADVTPGGPRGPTRQSLWRVPKTGAPPQLVASDQNAIASIAIGEPTRIDPEGAVFWTVGAAGGDAGVGGSLWKSGAPGTPPVIVVANRVAPLALIVIGERVYWSDRDVDAAGTPIGAILSASTSGGATTRLHETAFDQIPRTFDVTPDGTLVWTTADPVLGNEAEAEVRTLSLSAPASSATRIAGADSGGAGAIETASSAEGTLFFYSGPSAITAVTRLNTPGRFVRVSGFVDRIEQDETSIYFVDPNGDLAAWGTSSATQALRTVAIHLDPASAFEVDAACVYWIDARAETVTMVHK